MENVYTAKIKSKMSPFQQTGINDPLLLEAMTILYEKDIHIDADLMHYLFHNILGFNVPREIYEKIDYIIDFKFLEGLGRIWHSKFKFHILVDKSVSDEVTMIFIEVSDLIEKAFLEYSKSALVNNKYSLKNNYIKLKEKVTQVEKMIFDLHSGIEDQEVLFFNMGVSSENNLASSQNEEHQNLPNDSRIIVNTIDSLKTHEDFDNFLNTRMKISLLTEFYLDSIFSLVEHITVLIAPMTPFYDDQKPYRKFINSDWETKLKTLAQGNQELLTLIDSLKYNKEVFRNRYSHGLFSRELEVSLQIPDFGMYRIWVGDNLKGFRNIKREFEFRDFMVFRDLNESLSRILRSEYRIQFIIIDADIPTFLDRSIYGNALSSIENAELFVHDYWLMQDRINDMDW